MRKVFLSADFVKKQRHSIMKPHGESAIMHLGMVRILQNRRGSMKLKTRIKISMVGIMAAMVAIYTAIILGSTIQTYRRDMEDSLRSVGEQKLMTMDSLMNTMVTITEKPLFDNTILSILRKSAEDYRQAQTGYQQYLDYETVNARLYTEMFYENEYVYAITLFGFHTETAYTKQRSGKGLLPGDPREAEWVQRLRQTNGRQALIFPLREDDLYPGEEPVISVGRLLMDPIGQQPLGLIRVDIAARDLKNILEGDEDTQVVLLSEAEELLYTSLPSGEWREALERLRPSRVTVSSRSRQFGFSLTSLAPKDQLKRNIRRTLLTMILLTGAFGALIPFITELITRNSMKPISEINQLMKEVRAGDLSVRAKVETGGEFAEVCDSFNKMIINTEQLIRQVKLQEREKMEAEYQALQAQISPHFMLNTLNTIKWMAVIQGARTIEQALNAFSQLLSFAVREKSEKIPIRKELDMMRYYTEILSLRYFDRFRIRYDVDKAVLDCCTLKYILQTLVENSIFHGLDLVERSIEIRVRIRREPDRIVYEVQDNGAGMSPARIEEVLHQKHLKGKGMMKIGLYNIQQRIRLVFGEEYGISIRSEEGAYTVVRVEIPVLEAEDVSDSDR